MVSAAAFLVSALVLGSPEQYGTGWRAVATLVGVAALFGVAEPVRRKFKLVGRTMGCLLAVPFLGLIATLVFDALLLLVLHALAREAGVLFLVTNQIEMGAALLVAGFTALIRLLLLPFVFEDL